MILSVNESIFSPDQQFNIYKFYISDVSICHQNLIHEQYVLFIFLKIDCSKNFPFDTYNPLIFSY